MNAVEILARTRLFSGLAPDVLERLAARSRERALAAGDLLFAIGDPAQQLFVVAMGRLRVTLADGSIANDIDRHEPVGEIALLAGEPHSARCQAIRDSRLLVIEREELMDCLHQHPQAWAELTRMVIQRLRQNLRGRSAVVRPPAIQALSLIPGSGQVDLLPLAQALSDAIDRGHSRVIDSALVDHHLGLGMAQASFGSSPGEQRLQEWLQAQERTWKHLVWVGDAEANGWTARCLRHADRVVVVVDAREAPGATLPAWLERRSRLAAPLDLLLLHSGERPPPGRVQAWCEALHPQGHYLLRPGDRQGLLRLARHLSGRALGLVLGGGGARGFAHLGLMRALEELRLPVDLVGGSSMGAFLGGLMAQGHDAHSIRHIARESFVDHNYLNDYVLPRVALIRGRKFLNHLRRVFADGAIEDLAIPYFCVSTNLTQGSAVVHRDGPLHLWVGTSMAVPGVAPPVAWRGDLLVDGAVVNSLPTDIMQAMGRGPILASDVSTEGALALPGVEGPDPEALLRRSRLSDDENQRPGLLSILFRTATLTSESGRAARAARADLYLRMPVGGVALFDWQRMDEIIERSYQKALPLLERWKSEAGLTV
ncbi:MAG TPA: patatin-like phospholipase family protein [Nevskiaceae bacterium]|nr:patatin-like phospholipase family protein [Nevskiaceae bacterium]